MEESGYKWTILNQDEHAPHYELQQVQERIRWGWDVDRISRDMAIPVEKVEYYLEASKPRRPHYLARDIGSGIGTVFVAAVSVVGFLMVVTGALLFLALVWRL